MSVLCVCVSLCLCVLFGLYISSSIGPNLQSPPPFAMFSLSTGALQSVLSKATKYALFDPTTQMAYIPLDDESKVRDQSIQRFRERDNF